MRPELVPRPHSGPEVVRCSRHRDAVSPGSKHTIALAVALGWAGSAQAAISNGDFSAGLSDWIKNGNVVAVPLDFASAPQNHAVLSTPGVDFLFGGSTLPAATLEMLIGLPSGGLGPGAVGGSILQQTFSASAGEVVRFDALLYTDDDPIFASDFVFWALDGTIVQQLAIGDVTLAPTLPTVPFLKANAWGTLNIPIASTGSHVLTFGAVGVPDDIGGTALGVTDVQLIPEPGAWAMLLVGLAGVGFVLRRRRS